jgi:uncharacterized damage-inducible protein DinB
VLLETFEGEAKQARCVLEAVKDSQMQYVPMEGMRTLGELANHLAQIPLLDPDFFNGKISDVENARAREAELNRETTSDMISILDEGIKAMTQKFSNMSEDEFFSKTLTTFYEQGPKRNWAHYFPEIITHIAMHKMQLWMYLKLSGASVNMMTYYGHHQE